MRRFYFYILFATVVFSTSIAKRPLNHDDLDGWKSTKIDAISPSGKWSAFTVAPQEGDGVLSLRSSSGKIISIPRGYRPSFSADERFAVVSIKPLFSDTRKAKIAGKKDFELPQDTLAIVNLSTGNIEKIPNVINYKIGEKSGNFLAYQSCDTSLIKPKDLKDKKAGKPLLIRSFASRNVKNVKWVDEYNFSKDGRHIALKITPPEKDSLATAGVALVSPADTSMILIDRDKRFYTLPVFDDNSSMLAYTASEDSIESGTRHARLYVASLNDLGETKGIDPIFTTEIPVNLMPPHVDDPEMQRQLEQQRAEEISRTAGDTLRINQYAVPKFSRNGRFLYIDVAPVVAPNDTSIVDFETAALDIWRWDSPRTPPQEKANLEKLRKRGMPVVLDLHNDGTYNLITRNPLANVNTTFDLNGEWVLLSDPSEDIVSSQWDYAAPEKFSLVNVVSGKIIPIGKLPYEMALSPDSRFAVWFDGRAYHAMDASTEKQYIISEGVTEHLWNEDDDHPMGPQPYGIAGWGDDNRVLVYDRHDIWSLDLTGKSAPFILTAGEGRKRNLELRYRRLDPENMMLKSGETMVLDLFDYGDKRRGLATIKYGVKPSPVSIKVLDNHRYSRLKKAKDADVFLWQRGNFEEIPEIYISNSYDFAKGKRLTSVNDQKEGISWGTAQLVKWNAYDGKPSEGVLYLPEDFDPNAIASYPMLSVFYETGSEELYTHYTMEPSWSWVNYPFYVSRGYVIFVPDIHYTAGLPGESCYNYVCSGVEEICHRFPAIDPKRLGIDGQSWGGYQTAYLVTRTNMFACAGSGAPVANMTSAFGGIRWGSGDSRQAQYEMGQSRIGRNLWEAPELYIANSPLFHANRVNTPLLIMHNDEDGAVPWYQGIEMFMALRRLNKPVWLLQYNGESHNLRQRKNCKDITKRLQQFFDHYLKGDPMPRWMREGISPLRKGQDLGF